MPHPRPDDQIDLDAIVLGLVRELHRVIHCQILVRCQQHHRRQPGKVLRPQGREQRVFEVTIAGVGTDALLAVQLVLEQIAVRVCEDRVALPATKPAPR